MSRVNWENALKLAKRFWNWEPHSQGQLEFLTDPSPEKIAACGRRWGKSEATSVDLVMYALAVPSSTQFVVAPTDDQTKIIMQAVSRRLSGIPAIRGYYSERFSPYHSISFKQKGVPTVIHGRTAHDHGKGIRGNRAHRVIVEEASYISEVALSEAIRPMLADTGGDMVMIGTPAGRNHFFRKFNEARINPRVKAFRFPSTDNPHLSAEWLENERTQASSRVWAQEYLAEFLESEGQVFRNVLESVVTGPLPEPVGLCSIGIDLAKTTDWTVVSVLDGIGSQREIHRFQRISWPAQIQRLDRIISAYPDATVYIDATGVGDPVFDQLRAAMPYARLIGVKFTSAVKEQLIENLAMLLERSALSLLPHSVQTSELLSYEYKQGTGLRASYNAPEGGHDDTVIALALSAWALRPRQEFNIYIGNPQNLAKEESDLSDG